MPLPTYRKLYFPNINICVKQLVERAFATGAWRELYLGGARAGSLR